MEKRVGEGRLGGEIEEMIKRSAWRACETIQEKLEYKRISIGNRHKDRHCIVIEILEVSCIKSYHLIKYFIKHVLRISIF